MENKMFSRAFNIYKVGGLMDCPTLYMRKPRIKEIK